MTEHHPMTTPPPPVGKCRLCGDDSWIADDTGPVHLCCTFWQTELAAGRQCPSCAAARTLRRQRTPA